ncbi:MAG: MerR family transcriptional regulator [Muribaculaceae bacterium]|nr:MerR family transcriptional regulator [Muribaculaceae bacterium]
MDSLNKKYYKISEVAEIINVAPSTLRFWESQFTVVKPKRNDKGTRFYTPRDIEVIRMIYFLVKEKGLKLEAAQEQIRRNHSGVSRRFEAIERLRAVRAVLQNMLDALNSKRV